MEEEEEVEEEAHSSPPPPPAFVCLGRSCSGCETQPANTQHSEIYCTTLGNANNIAMIFLNFFYHNLSFHKFLQHYSITAELYTACLFIECHQTYYFVTIYKAFKALPCTLIR